MTAAQRGPLIHVKRHSCQGGGPESPSCKVDENRVELLRNRDPITFLQRRSEALAERSADLDRLAEAWQPLYKTLTPEQRQRLAAVAIFVLHEMSDAVQTASYAVR